MALNRAFWGPKHTLLTPMLHLTVVALVLVGVNNPGKFLTLLFYFIITQVLSSTQISANTKTFAKLKVINSSYS
jgi:hypothetical protein